MREAVEKKVLSENDRLAAALRQRYRDEGILCVNLVSSPGSGKTALLEKTLAAFAKDAAVAVLTGDLQTDNDAKRLARYGFPVRQIVTGGTCHLDARMVERHLNEVGFRGPGILLIENVGNRTARLQIAWPALGSFYLLAAGLGKCGETPLWRGSRPFRRIAPPRPTIRPPDTLATGGASMSRKARAFDENQ